MLAVLCGLLGAASSSQVMVVVASSLSSSALLVVLVVSGCHQNHIHCVHFHDMEGPCC